MKVGVLAVQGNSASISRCSRASAWTVVEVRLPEQLDGLVIPGSEPTAIGRP